MMLGGWSERLSEEVPLKQRPKGWGRNIVGESKKKGHYYLLEEIMCKRLWHGSHSVSQRTSRTPVWLEPSGGKREV